MIPSVAVHAFMACLSTSPSFAAVDAKLEAAGFRFDGKQGSDVRWKNPTGIEAFRSETADSRVCSVWFDQDYETVVEHVEPLLRVAELQKFERDADRLGALWKLGDGRMVRLVTKQGNSRRLGLALFASKE